MGNSPACTKPTLAVSARNSTAEVEPTTKSSTSTASSDDSDDDSERKSYDSPTGDDICAVPATQNDSTAMRSWETLQIYRTEQRDEACAAAQCHMNQVAEMENCLKLEVAAERDLQREQVASQTELKNAEAQAMHEADLRQVLLTELGEHESYKSKLHQQLLDGENIQSDLTADVTNLRQDLEKLRQKMCWAERYLGGLEIQRSKLRAEVRETEHYFDICKRQLHTATIAADIFGNELLRQQRKERSTKERQQLQSDLEAQLMSQKLVDETTDFRARMLQNLNGQNIMFR
jgi:hypothetical protein